MSARVDAAAAARPTATPTSSTRAPCPTTIRWTRRACAPSAMRTPISRVRSATMYDSTPYCPTVPRMTASSEITPSVSMVNASGSRDSSARPSIV